MEIKLLTQKEFDGIGQEWNDLLLRSASESVFLRWEWVHTWWSIFQRNKRLLILTARQTSGELCGIAPFYIDQTGRLGLRTIQFCSEELSPDYMDIIAEKGQEESVARAVAQDLQQCAGEWDLIALDNLRAESALLSDPSLFQGYAHKSQVSIQCPYIKIAGTFDDYHRPRRELRSFGFKRKLKILFDEKKVAHRIASDAETLSKEMDAVFHLHEKRAQLKRIQSNFVSADIRRFQQEVSRLFFQQKILSLHLLYDGERPISAYYAFIYKQKVFLYQTGFDPEYSKWSAGAVLLYFCVQRAFDDGLREFDFLKGTESYKNLWSNAVRNEMRLTVYNKSLRGCVAYAMERMKEILRPLKARWAGR